MRSGQGWVSVEYGAGGNQQEVLTRVFRTPHEVSVQVCVPKQLRKEVMQLAHEAPMAGHMGVKWTKTRVLQDFYWPGVCGQVAHFVRSCPECQKTQR